MPFKPGESGNPAGRPKQGETISDLVREVGEQRKMIKVAGKKRMLPLIKITILKMYDLAMSGDVAAFKALAERRDGKVPTPIEHSGADGVPLFQYDAKLDEIE